MGARCVQGMLPISGACHFGMASKCPHIAISVPANAKKNVGSTPSQVACETFCLDTDETFTGATLQSESLTIDTVRLVPVNETASLNVQLGKYHNRNVIVGRTKCKPTNLHRHEGATAATRSTILVEMSAAEAVYEPGDHVGIFPANRKAIVDGILQRLTGIENADEVLQLQLLKESHSTNGGFVKINC